MVFDTVRLSSVSSYVVSVETETLGPSKICGQSPQALVVVCRVYVVSGGCRERLRVLLPEQEATPVDLTSTSTRDIKTTSVQRED